MPFPSNYLARLRKLQEEVHARHGFYVAGLSKDEFDKMVDRIAELENIHDGSVASRHKDMRERIAALEAENKALREQNEGLRDHIGRTSPRRPEPMQVGPTVSKGKPDGT